jgi:hypothetical protein
VGFDPDAWTVQGRLRFSRAPIWGADGLVVRPAMVRVYAIAGPGGHWQVLPGGMTRVAQGEDASVSMQRGGTSLDTWVMTDGEVDTFSMLPRPLRVQDIAGRSRPVSSRTAENLFWLGRYTERAEHLVRLSRQVLALAPTGLRVYSLVAVSSFEQKAGYSCKFLQEAGIQQQPMPVGAAIGTGHQTGEQGIRLKAQPETAKHRQQKHRQKQQRGRQQQQQ